MAFIQLKLNTDNTTAEQIADFLTELGAVAITYTDSYDTLIVETILGETKLWNNTDLTALFDANTEMFLIIAALKNSQFMPNDFAYKIEQVEDKDWQKEWMKNYNPLKFGKRVWICPSWKPIPDPNAINIILDPGLAFGTGTHPTTAMCLEWLDSIDLENKSLIDFGCGSGILAITALKLGAKQASGIDIDPQAILSSQNNAKQNDIEHKLTLYLADNIPNNLQADFVIANILAGPLKELYSTIKNMVKNQGYLALSGILTKQADDIITIYKNSFEILDVKEMEEWCILKMQKILLK